MKGFIKIFSLLICIFGLVFSACNKTNDKDEKMGTMSNNTDLSGVWLVTDSTGNRFEITLNKDGTATSTWSVMDNGKWEVVSQKKAHIKWRNGTNEFIIVDERGEALKQTFVPGRSIEGKPNDITKIQKK